MCIRDSLGIGIVIDELIVLLPLSFSRILCAVLLTVSAFSFTVTGIGEVSDYQKTSDIDVALTSQLINLDTKENITNTDKNVYVFSGQHYYDETKCVSWLDHIRGVSGNYADFTGCMRHITGAANTNNVIDVYKRQIQFLITSFASSGPSTSFTTVSLPSRDLYTLKK